MSNIRTRLQQKLAFQKAVKAAVAPSREMLESMIAKHLADQTFESRRAALPEDANGVGPAPYGGDADMFQWHDGRDLPVQSLVLDVLYDVIKRDENIESLTLRMKDGKELLLKWDSE